PSRGAKSITQRNSAMKYMLLVYSPESAWTNEEWTSCTVESTAVCHDLQAKRQFIAAPPLHPAATAATVIVRYGKPQLTTGPFAETTEQLGGFFLIDVPHLDDAVATAARLPSAKKGTVEVRPVDHLEGLPPDHFEPRPAHVGAAESRYMLICYDDEQ